MKTTSARRYRLTWATAERIATTRVTDPWGTKDPYPGRVWSHGLTGDEGLPPGYSFRNVTTWGLHLTKDCL